MGSNGVKGVARVFLAFVLAFAAVHSASSVSYAEEKDPFRKMGIQMFSERPTAPEFTLRRFDDGKEVRLSDFKGKVVFLNFFATWCTPCRYEMPEMEALYQEFKGKGFEILAVSIDRNTEPIGPFAKSLKLTFPIVHDPNMMVARQFAFRGPPLSYLIDRRGRVVGGAAGPRYWNAPTAHQIVKKLLAEPVS